MRTHVSNDGTNQTKSAMMFCLVPLLLFLLVIFPLNCDREIKRRCKEEDPYGLEPCNFGRFSRDGTRRSLDLTPGCETARQGASCRRNFQGTFILRAGSAPVSGRRWFRYRKKW